MGATCHYTFVQTHGMHTTESEPECKLRALGDYDVSLWLHRGKKGTALVGAGDNGASMHLRSEGMYEKSLYLLPQLCCEPQTALKKK